MATSPTFLFHGLALGFGATFRRPFQASIPSQASAVVSIGGGYASDRVGPSSFINGVSFEEASVEVSGGPDEEPGSFVTIARATLRKLRILDNAFFAEEMHCQLVSRHGGSSGMEPNISAAGSYIRGLHIGGVEIRAGNMLDLPDTDEAFRAKYASNKDFAQKIRETANWVPPKDVAREAIHPELVRFYEKCWAKGAPQPPTFNGRMIVGLFDSLNPATRNDQITVIGNTITLRNVGRFHLGELLVERGNRRLSMLRFSLGSDTEGQGSGPHTGTNGSPYP